MSEEPLFYSESLSQPQALSILELVIKQNQINSRNLLSEHEGYNHHVKRLLDSSNPLEDLLNSIYNSKAVMINLTRINNYLILLHNYKALSLNYVSDSMMTYHENYSDSIRFTFKDEFKDKLIKQFINPDTNEHLEPVKCVKYFNKSQARDYLNERYHERGESINFNDSALKKLVFAKNPLMYGLDSIKKAFDDLVNITDYLGIIELITSLDDIYKHNELGVDDKGHLHVLIPRNSSTMI